MNEWNTLVSDIITSPKQTEDPGVLDRNNMIQSFIHENNR